MNVTQLTSKLQLNQLGTVTGDERTVTSVYCCDLLSFVMGHAPADSAWLTVMGNLNAVAVATLADISCIILCHGMTMDEEGLKKANEQEVAVYQSSEAIFDTAQHIATLIG